MAGACDVRDEHGRPVQLTPHQWRHTFATRLINRDVPQEVVRRLLDHDSAQMTAHYARLTTRPSAGIGNGPQGQHRRGADQLDPDGPLAEAAWAKTRSGRATQTLPNGYCGLPVQKTCPHANACLTCPVFVTTAEFLPQHRVHRGQVIELIAAAQPAARPALAEMNQQVLGNLDRIIDTLDTRSDGIGTCRCRLTTPNTSPRRPPPREATRRRAVAALRRMDTSGLPVTFDALAREAGVSRSWIYSQTRSPGREPTAPHATARAPHPGRPDRQRASDASLLRRVRSPHSASSDWRPTTSGSATLSPQALGHRRTAAILGQRPGHDTPEIPTTRK